MTGRYARDYYETSAPSGAHSGRRACPFPHRLHGTRATPDGSHVHHTTDRRGRRPALPQRHRHDYAVGFHRGLLPGGISPGSEFPSGAGRQTVRTATQPRSARFELEGRLRGFKRWFLTYAFPFSLAGPAPSGSTSTSRHCQGCFPPFPASPGSGCPQLHPAATTAWAVEVFHPHSVMQRLVAHDAVGPQVHVVHTRQVPLQRTRAARPSRTPSAW